MKITMGPKMQTKSHSFLLNLPSATEGKDSSRLLWFSVNGGSKVNHIAHVLSRIRKSVEVHELAWSPVALLTSLWIEFTEASGEWHSKTRFLITFEMQICLVTWVFLHCNTPHCKVRIGDWCKILKYTISYSSPKITLKVSVFTAQELPSSSEYIRCLINCFWPSGINNCKACIRQNCTIDLLVSLASCQNKKLPSRFNYGIINGSFS